MSMSRRPEPVARPQASAGSTLGMGLMLLGAILEGIVALWLAASIASGYLSATAAVFTIGLSALFTTPLILAGIYLRRKGVSEAVETQTFQRRRSAIESDRVARRELARELEQRVALLERAVPRLKGRAATVAKDALNRLQEVSADVNRPGYDARSLLEQAPTGDRQVDEDAVRRYNDLVIDEARRLDDVIRQLNQPGQEQELAEMVNSLARHVDEREALLGRGRRASALTTGELFQASASPRQRVESPVQLGLDDAVSYELDDYVVRAVVTYFAGARTWKNYQLHDGKQERWLEVRQGGAELSWLEPVSLPDDRPAESVTVDGQTFTRRESITATAAIVTGAATQDGLLVQYRRYSAPSGDMLIVEQWPDTIRALRGQTIGRESLDLWTKPQVTE